jgi:hypothetical protein
MNVRSAQFKIFVVCLVFFLVLGAGLTIRSQLRSAETASDCRKTSDPVSLNQHVDALSPDAVSGRLACEAR